MCIRDRVNSLPNKEPCYTKVRRWIRYVRALAIGKSCNSGCSTEAFTSSHFGIAVHRAPRPESKSCQSVVDTVIADSSKFLRLLVPLYGAAKPGWYCSTTVSWECKFQVLAESELLSSPSPIDGIKIRQTIRREMTSCMTESVAIFKKDLHSEDEN